ncbi:hypothetical protein [Paraburkholderia kirstenboschensis]|uniref:Transposase n=1 Tax=Paraburkholderia kirstenboschensis TaxID=1245436 RepID=A0ABZ0EBR3_9BURK|nr:hypothetical protein [Paraburkholderia kirstenboschensis]WOD14385.1 hypothetical protein RW095_02560 [Paraburkholderia kirstenboschensis]
MVLKQRANRVELALVVDNSTQLPECGTTTERHIPEGWFDEEVGYVGGTAARTVVFSNAAGHSHY